MANRHGASPIETFLARPSTEWSVGMRESAWRELCALVEATHGADLAALVAHANAALAHAYQDAGTSAVYFEDDQRIAPRHWCLPKPHAGLGLARLVALDLSAPDVSDAELTALAESSLADAITHVSLHSGQLTHVLPRLLSSPLFRGVDTLKLRECSIGGNEGAKQLAAAPTLASIVVLDLAFCGIDERAVETILASAHLTQLTILKVDANCIDPHGERGQSYRDALNEKLAARGIEMTFV